MSSPAVTIRITVNYSRAIFFSSELLNRNQVLSLHLHLTITFSLQYCKSHSTVRLNLNRKSSEVLPKFVKTNANSLLVTMKLRSFWINNLFKNL